MPWLAAIFMVISVPMPWIAVVIANGVGEPEDKRQPRVYKPAIVREQNRRWEEQQRERALKEAEMRALGSTTSDATDTTAETEPEQRSDMPSADDANVIDMPDDDSSTSA